MARAKLPPFQQKGTHQAGDDEQSARVEFCYVRIREQMPKSRLKKEFREIFGEVNAKTIEKYIGDAKVLILADAADGKEVMRAQSYATYLGIITRKNESAPDGTMISFAAKDEAVIAAQSRIDKLFGLEAPTKIAPTSPDGETPYEQLTDAELDARLALAITART